MKGYKSDTGKKKKGVEGKRIGKWRNEGKSCRLSRLVGWLRGVVEEGVGCSVLLNFFWVERDLCGSDEFKCICFKYTWLLSSSVYRIVRVTGEGIGSNGKVN